MNLSYPLGIYLFIDVIKTPLKQHSILFDMPFGLEKFKDNSRAGQQTMSYAPNDFSNLCFKKNFTCVKKKCGGRSSKIPLYGVSRLISEVRFSPIPSLYREGIKALLN